MITTFHGFTCIVFKIFWNEEQSEMASFPYKPFSQYFHIIIQKMKETKEFEIIQREADVPTNIFSSQFKKPEIDEILGNQADKTAASTAPESGQWRSNEMLQCSPIHQAERALGLRHLTSFEEKSMEDHGKILKRTLENYLKIYNIRLVDEEQFEGEMEQKFTNWDQVQVGLTSLQNFEQKKLNSLLKFSRRNLEAQLVLRLIFCNIPEQFLPESLLITDEVFQEYQRSNIQVKDEDQIETYVSLNYCNLSQKIKIELQQSDILPRDAEGEYKFEEMIGVWMETVFLALNGVFENPESRKTPLCSLQGFETFYESRKLIKFD